MRAIELDRLVNVATQCRSHELFVLRDVITLRTIRYDRKGYAMLRLLRQPVEAGD